MKKLSLLILAITFVSLVQAKSLRDMWLSMPDSLMPVLDKNLRLELIELKDMGVKAEVKNLLGEDCAMDTLAADYLHMAICETFSCEMLMLPKSDGDSLLCVIKTFSGPEKESEVRFYDQQWKSVNSQDLLPADIYLVDGYFKAKPDTMGEEKYQELHALLEPKMWFVEFSTEEKYLVFQLALPSLSHEEKCQINPVLMQRKLKWNNVMFKEG